MRRALRLAARGRGRTSPNPMVGAVVVKRGRAAGEGYHRRAGGPHAEVWALSRAGGAAEGATLYVSLEPCCHQGRTPPCTEAVIESGVRRVVAAGVDPNPRVKGRGVRRLRRAGIEVTVGVLGEEARRLNAAYFKHVSTGLPLVSLKAAMSLDGKIATAAGESKWITGERARAVGRRLRGEHDAVLVGVETVIADDPQLTVRGGRGKDPLRVIADSKARTPTTARVLAGESARTIVATTRAASAERRRGLERAGAAVWVVRAQGGRVDLRALVRRLGEEMVQSVMIEGGGTLAASALAAGVVDRVYFFVSPRIIGGAEAKTPVEGKGVGRLAEAWRISSMKVRRVGDDLLITGDISE